MILGASCCAKCFSQNSHNKKNVGWLEWLEDIFYSKCLFANSIFLVAKALSLWFSTLKNNTHFSSDLVLHFVGQEIRDAPRCEKKPFVFCCFVVGCGMCDD